MKKSILALLMAASFGAFAQEDLAITMNSPTSSTTLGPGISFNIDVTIDNIGTVDVTPSDTVWFYPTVNGNPLITIQGTDTLQVIYPITGGTISANGGDTTVSVSLGGLNLGSGAPSTINFCIEMFATGPNWVGTEPNTSDNSSCATVNYDDGSVGIGENIAYTENANRIIDDSFYSNGIYSLDIKGVSNGAANVKVYNIAGQEVHVISKEAQNNSLNGEIDLSGLGNGVYIVQISSNNQALSTKKIIVE